MGSTPAARFRQLTAFEQVVLSVVGDGCDDIEAARRLSLSPATISTVRRGLHRKLHVQHRGELVRLAAQAGFVRFTPEGVERPGFGLLTAAYHPRDPKRCAPGLAQLTSA
jgi:DNA-binding CsgD family transcriptional regulator